MIRLLLSLCACILLAPARAETDPLGELGEGLDLSILDEKAASPAESEDDAPPRHLFASFDHLPAIERPRNAADEDGEELQVLELPPAPYLVAPNPARVDDAYRRIGRAIGSLDLKPRFPLKVLLHADGNVSVAQALADAPDPALPSGLDLSPQPAVRLAGVWVDVQVADKTAPPVVAAVVALRRRAAEADLELDTSELYFLPAAPGNVLVALRIK